MIGRGSEGRDLKAEVLRVLAGLEAELRDVARGIRERPWLEDGDAEDFEARAGEVSGLAERLGGARVVEDTFVGGPEDRIADARCPNSDPRGARRAGGVEPAGATTRPSQKPRALSASW